MTLLVYAVLLFVVAAFGLLGLVWYAGHGLRQADEAEPKLWMVPSSWTVDYDGGYAGGRTDTGPKERR